MGKPIDILNNRMVFKSFLVLLGATQAVNDDPLFWGTYRPYPYVGLRSRSAESPLVGLMWYKPSLYKKGLT